MTRMQQGERWHLHSLAVAALHEPGDYFSTGAALQRILRAIDARGAHRQTQGNLHSVADALARPLTSATLRRKRGVESVLNSLRTRVYAHNARGHMGAYIYKICQSERDGKGQRLLRNMTRAREGVVPYGRSYLWGEMYSIVDQTRSDVMQSCPRAQGWGGSESGRYRDTHARLMRPSSSNDTHSPIHDTLTRATLHSASGRPVLRFNLLGADLILRGA